MKKILLMALVVLTITSVFAQSKKIKAKLGDTIIVGSPVAVSPAHPIARNKAPRRRPPVQKAATPIPNVAPIYLPGISIEEHNRQMAEHDKFMYLVLDIALVGVIVALILMAIVYSNRPQAYAYPPATAP